MVKLRIGVDYDGTISDIVVSKSRWIKENLGLEVPPWKTDRTSCVPIIGLDNYTKMGNLVYGREFTLGASEVPLAVDGLFKLAKMGELYLVTMRHTHKLGFAKEWLELKGLLGCFAGFGVMKNLDGTKKTKGQVCKDFSLDVLVDDDESHLAGISIPNFKKILLKNGSTEQYTLPKDIHLARSWPEVFNYL